MPMVTVGDAIQSFLMRPDGYTKGMCLASQHDFRKVWPSSEPKKWTGQVKIPGRFKLTPKIESGLLLFV